MTLLDKAGIAALATLGIVSIGGVELAADNFACSQTSCPKGGGCAGDWYSMDGCKMQCYVTEGAGGEIKKAGNAGCGS